MIDEQVVASCETLEELEAYLQSVEIGETEEQGPEPKPRFVVDSPTKAEWVMGKVRQVVAEQAADKACLQDTLLRANSWYERQERRRRNRLGHLLYMLRPWALSIYEASGGRVKSVDVPSGQLQIRQPAVKIETTDVDGTAALNWLRDHDPENRLGLFNVKAVLALASLKKLAPEKLSAGDRAELSVTLLNRDTGEERTERVPGLVAAMPQELEFKVKTTGDGDDKGTLINFRDVVAEPKSPEKETE